MDSNFNFGNNTSDIHSPTPGRDESHRYQDLVTGATRTITPTSRTSRYISSEADTAFNSNTNASSGYHRYSVGESGNESGSDTTALPSNQHVKRTSSFNKSMKNNGQANSGFGPDNITRGNRTSLSRETAEDESDVDLDFGFDQHDYHESSSKIPLVSYKSKSERSMAQSSQPKRQGEYGRISNDSFHSGHSQERGDNDDDDDDLDFGEEEEAVGMMTGNRTNRSGIGNRQGHGHGHDTGADAKLPNHGGSLFSSFLNMANSIIGAGEIAYHAIVMTGAGSSFVFTHSSHFLLLNK